MNPNIRHGGEYYYRPGYPQVHFSTVSFLNKNNQAGISVVADIVYGSLKYRENNGRQQSNIAVDVRIVSRAEDDSFNKLKHYELKIVKDDSSIVNNQKSFIFEKNVQLPPGKYKVYFTVTDLFLMRPPRVPLVFTYQILKIRLLSSLTYECSVKTWIMKIQHGYLLPPTLCRAGWIR